MYGQLNTKRLQATRRLVSHIALVLTLVTTVLAGCATSAVREPEPARRLRAVGRFVVISPASGTVDVQRQDGSNLATEHAAAGAIAAPGAVLHVLSYTGSSAAMSAAVPVLAPLAVIGLAAGAVSGASRARKIHETHRRAFEELNRKLSDPSLQSDAIQAVVRRLAARFGERFAGTTPQEADSAGADTAFEIQLRSVRGEMDENANVTLTIAVHIRVLALPDQRELRDTTLEYSTARRWPASLAADLHQYLDDQVWSPLAGDIAGLVYAADPRPLGPSPPDENSNGRGS